MDVYTVLEAASSLYPIVHENSNRCCLVLFKLEAAVSVCPRLCQLSAAQHIKSYTMYVNVT